MTTKFGFNRRLFLLPALVLATGCTTQMPLVSHAHVGHALTTWHDTPGQKALMTVAADDLAVAEREAAAACSTGTPAERTEHMQNVVHALVPEAAAHGTGSGYGAIRALMSTIEHLEYAATSPDSSLNLVSSVAALSVHGESVHERLKVAAELAHLAVSAPTAGRAGYCRQLQRELRVAIHGGDAGADGNGFPSIGFVALQDELVAALERERDPVYTPVPRRYVLGLVRLPSGQWQYRLPKPNRDAFINSGSYGY